MTVIIQSSADMLSRPLTIDQGRQEREAEELLKEIRLLSNKYVMILFYTFLLRDHLVKFSSKG